MKKATCKDCGQKFERPPLTNRKYCLDCMERRMEAKTQSDRALESESGLS